MRSDSFLGNTRYTNQILKLDQQYVESIVLNYSGDNFVSKCEKVLGTYYLKPEFTCELCGAGNKRKANRPASFYPTEVGYIYTCLNPQCIAHGGMHLNQFLLHRNPEVASKYQLDRFVHKLSGRGFNCPDPPKNIRKEYYQRIERETKERNQMEYKKRNGLS